VNFNIYKLKWQHVGYLCQHRTIKLLLNVWPLITECVKIRFWFKNWDFKLYKAVDVMHSTLQGLFWEFLYWKIKQHRELFFIFFLKNCMAQLTQMDSYQTTCCILVAIEIHNLYPVTTITNTRRWCKTNQAV